MRLFQKITYLFLLTSFLTVSGAYAKTKLTIATVNNGDMVVMQKLSSEFEKQNPDIELDWVVLEENVLRQRLTTDIAIAGGQYDVMTIGSYEVPIWASRRWLTAFNDLPSSYDLGDMLPAVRDGLSYEGNLYALPFYAESSMMFYRKDLFKNAGLTMPERPTWEQVKQFAAAIHDPSNKVYGICLRGKAGWGENMAFLSTMVNSFGGRWFDENWKPALDSKAWKDATNFYVSLLNTYGPPGTTANGFNENLSLFANGQCGMWIDATVAAGMLFNPEVSKVSDQLGFAQAPYGITPKGSHWFWAWSLAIPTTSKNPEEAKKFLLWATSKEYLKLVGETNGWVAVPPGTRASTYENPKYQEAAPFAAFVRKAIENADTIDSTLEPKPYIGIQYATIPEFQSIGTQVGQQINGALAGKIPVEEALKTSQKITLRQMRRSGYVK